MEIEITYFEEIKRKLIHLSSLWMVAATLLFPYFFPENGRWISCILFAALLILTVFSEHDYANNGKYLGWLYGILFGKMLRKENVPRLYLRKEDARELRGQRIQPHGLPFLPRSLEG